MSGAGSLRIVIDRDSVERFKAALRTARRRSLLCRWGLRKLSTPPDTSLAPPPMPTPVGGTHSAGLSSRPAEPLSRKASS